MRTFAGGPSIIKLTNLKQPKSSPGLNLPVSLWLVKLRAIPNKSEKVVGLRKAGKKEHSIPFFKPLYLSKKRGMP